MSSESTPQGREDPMFVLRRYIEQVQQDPEQAAIEARLMGQAVEERMRIDEALRLTDAMTRKKQFEVAKHLSVAILEGPQHAKRLIQRHNSRVITPRLIQAIELSRDPEHSHEGIRQLSQLLEEAKTEGLFMEHYGEQQIRPPLESKYHRPGSQQQYTYGIVAEASGSHPSPFHPRFEKPAPAADCQILLPAPSTKGTGVVDLPTKGDIIRNPAAVQYMKAHPFATAIIADIVCDADMQGLKLAMSALEAGLERLQEVRALHREDLAVTHIVAFIATIKGLRLPDGTEVALKDLSNFLIPNLHSHNFFRHYRDEQNLAPLQGATKEHFTPIYTLVDRDVKYVLDGKTYNIIVDWDVVMARLAHSDTK